MNGSLIFVLLLVSIVMGVQLIRTWIKVRSTIPAGRDGELDATLARIEQLEERVRVLERIITENRFDLKREIDSL